ncbi:MAG: DUF3726 domain-containing protein [Pseudomonadota bacterium]
MDGTPHPARVALRPPETVMRLSRMGSFHPMRLSFMRILLRRIKAEGWQVTRPFWEVNDSGVGRAVYTATGPERSYSLIAFAHDLPDHLRSDRVIAEAWDATFTLFDGVPTRADLDRLEKHVPVQEAGRMSIRELTLSRANRSVRLFSYMLDALANGRQPDSEEIAKVGYLMRTTAVYGSAKFGLADREVYCERPELSAPFQAEMLTVWLIRAFSVDLLEHLARARGGSAAVKLDPVLRRGLGIGNSTGLGMAPFLLTHPVLIHNWMAARETALARVRSLAEFTDTAWAAFRVALLTAMVNWSGWKSEHPIQIGKLEALGQDLDALARYVESLSSDVAYPGDHLWAWGEENLSEEGQEQLLSLLLEPFGDEVDELAASLSADETSAFAITDPKSVAELSAEIDSLYDWALTKDWDVDEEQARLWYVSEEKLEPRLAERAEEPLEPYEQPLAPGRAVAALRRELSNAQTNASVATFLSDQPQHRDAVRRVQTSVSHAYAEIRDNTISAKMLPIDLLRAKLSFFGATRFDPRSDRWVRITMFKDAPFPDEIGTMHGDSWMFGRTSTERAAPEGHNTPAISIQSGRPTETTDADWSIGELQSLSVKAARGAGLSWGLATEAGRAVRNLSLLALPGAEALANDLLHRDSGRTLSVGVRLADSREVTLAESAEEPLVPLLLLPFLQDLADLETGFSVLAEDGLELFRVWHNGFETGENCTLKRRAVSIHRCATGASAPRENRVSSVPTHVISSLLDLAKKTYAPATEGSRLKGAGAGTTDND